MGLSIRDILILDYFDGKPLHHRIPPYKLHIYGPDANTRIDSLMEDGWIRSSRPQETVNMLPDKVLSDFLKRYDLSGEGTHAELTGRVISKIPEKDYAHGVPRIYVLTREGKAEIGHHMAYVLNVRENYGLTEGEIGESQNALTQRGEPLRPGIFCTALSSRKLLCTPWRGNGPSFGICTTRWPIFTCASRIRTMPCHTCTLSFHGYVGHGK